jgi:hypothetical protein
MHSFRRVPVQASSYGQMTRRHQRAQLMLEHYGHHMRTTIFSILKNHVIADKFV